MAKKDATTSAQPEGPKESDVVVTGDSEKTKVIRKASSEAEGWETCTKATQVVNGGCFVSVSTKQKNPDGSFMLAEAVTYVPGVSIGTDENGNAILVAN